MPKPQDVPAICRRCGRCCLAGGPALHREDLELVQARVLTRADLVCLRAGEYARDDITGALSGLGREIIKIRWNGSGPEQHPYACRFYDPCACACGIHHARPAECRALFCEDTRALADMYATGRLTRADMVNPSGSLWEVIAFHDQAFPAARAAGLARRAVSGDTQAARELAEIIESEAHFRQTFLARSRANPREMDFLFGRSLAQLAAQSGWSSDGPGEK